MECKCGCGQKLRKDNKTGFQKCHKQCALCSNKVRRSDTECCSKVCSAKLHWLRHPEMKENRTPCGEKNGRWGKKMSQEHKNILSEMMKIRWKNGNITSSTFRPKETNIEKTTRQTLEKLGLRFKQNYWLRNKDTTPREYDFYLQDDHLLLEVDGYYWHSLEKNAKNDKIKNELATELGYSLLRIPEKHCNEYAIAAAIADWRKKKNG